MKLLILGIDGATWKTIDRGLDLGVLPKLKQLLKQGQKSVLTSTNPPLTPCAWASFHTGKNPGYHGIVDFVSWDKYTKEPNLVDSTWLEETVWDQLGKRGKKISLINVPMTYPTPSINGTVVSGILTPDSDSLWSYPRSIKKQILEQLPEYEPISLTHSKPSEIAKEPLKFLKFIASRIEMRRDLGEFMMIHDDYDVLMVQFQVLDWIQHALWHALDPHHPNYDKKLEEKIHKHVFPTLDESISELWSKWKLMHKKNAEVLIMSDHGFQTHVGRINVGNIFYREGLLDQRAGTKKKLNKIIIKTGIELKDKSPFNLLGRSQWGYVYLKPDADLEATHKNIVTTCSRIKDREGNQLIRKIHRKAELYHGPKLDLLPDILLEPEDGYSITAAIDKQKPDLDKVIFGEDFHIGIHHADGIIFSTLPKLPNSIEDVASWILSAFSQGKDE